MTKRMKKHTLILFLLTGALCMMPSAYGEADDSEKKTPLSLITADAEEGFQLAIKLARKGVTETQPDKEVLFTLREVYSRDSDALIAASQVIAIHYQTVAAANNYWRESPAETACACESK